MLAMDVVERDTIIKFLLFLIGEMTKTVPCMRKEPFSRFGEMEHREKETPAHIDYYIGN